MKFKIMKNKFQNAINSAIRAVTKTDNTIFACILIQIDDGNIILTGYNPEMSIKAAVEAEISELGEVAVNARLLNDIVKKFPNVEISVESKDTRLILKAEKSRFEIACMESGLFPQSPAIEEISKITLKEKTLKDMIKNTIHAVSADPSKKQFHGAFLKIDGNMAEMFCIDGHRLAVKSFEISDSQQGQAIMHGTTLKQVFSVIEDTDKNIDIVLGKSQVAIVTEKIAITTGLLSSQFIDWNKFIPGKFLKTITVNKHLLESAIDKMMTIASKKYPVEFAISKKEMAIELRSDLGIASDVISIDDSTGENIKIGYNPAYWTDTLKAIPDETIEVKFTSDIGPTFITGDGYTHMLLPIRIGADE